MAFKSRRQARYLKLKSEGFTGAEAQVLSEFKFKQPYLTLMRRDRKRLVDEVVALDLSKTRTLATLRSWIDQVYVANGWEDAYVMLRDYRQRAIDKGDYIPPPIRKRKPTSKGNLERQKLKAKARRERGAISSQYNAQGNLIGDVVYNPQTGLYDVRLA